MKLPERSEKLNDGIYSTSESIIVFEQPHPTDVGWGFHGLTPVNPR